MDKKVFKKYYVLLLILLAAMLGGGIAVFAKIALKEIPPFSFTWIRFFIASLFLLPFFIRSRLKLNSTTVKIVVLSVLASANVILFAFGIKLTSASIGQMIYSASPLLTAVLSVFVLKEKFSHAKVFGLIVAFIGTLIIILIPLFENNFQINSAISGNILIFLAMIFYTVYSVIAKKVANNFKPIQVTSIFAFTTLVLTSVLAIYDLKTLPNWWQGVSLQALLAASYVGVVAALYYLLIQIIITKASPVISNLILYLQPVFAILLAIVFLEERLSFMFILGGILTLFGVWKTTQTKTNINT